MKFEEGCAGCFAGLSCQPRITIINLLQQNGRMSVSEIAKYFDTTQPTISHHLKYLKETGILSSKKTGKKIYYFIHPKCEEKFCLFR